MTDASGLDEDGTEPDLDDGLGELRDAAGAVLASLKWLIDAAERVVEDPETFDRVVASGRGLVEAFTSGFLDDGSDPGETEDQRHDGA